MTDIPDDVKLVMDRSFKAGFVRGQDARQKDPNLNEWFDRWLAVFGGEVTAILADRETRGETVDPDRTFCYSDDPEKLKRLLYQRDKFIVDSGNWLQFVASLPEKPVDHSATIRQLGSELSCARKKLDEARLKAMEEAAEVVKSKEKIIELDWAGRMKRREPRRDEFVAAIREAKDSING